MQPTKNNDRWWGRLFDRLNDLSYQAIFLSWIAAVVLFALVYTLLSYVPGNAPAPLTGELLLRLANALYYSVITATNTGYGDILPHGLSRLFAALEAVSGLFIFAVFITKLMSRRQDIALREVHKLTFENTFHNIRESLHTTRKDLDLVLEKGRSSGGLAEDDYQRLAVAYEQFANILNELPTFYRAGGGFYTLDRRREDLLLEAVRRTIERVHRMLAGLSESGCAWIDDEGSIARLRDLTRISHTCVEEWRRRSPYKEQESFEEVVLLADRIEAQIEHCITASEAPSKKKTKSK